jgi:hypothetical protein
MHELSSVNRLRESREGERTRAIGAVEHRVEVAPRIALRRNAQQHSIDARALERDVVPDHEVREDRVDKCVVDSFPTFLT